MATSRSPEMKEIENFLHQYDWARRMIESKKKKLAETGGDPSKKLEGELTMILSTYDAIVTKGRGFLAQKSPIKKSDLEDISRKIKVFNKVIEREMGVKNIENFLRRSERAHKMIEDKKKRIAEIGEMIPEQKDLSKKLEGELTTILSTYSDIAKRGKLLAQQHSIEPSHLRNIGSEISALDKSIETAILSACDLISTVMAEANVQYEQGRYEMAANKGHRQAQRIMGDAYAKGDEVKHSFERALSFYEKAADQGDMEASYLLAKYYFKTENYLVAVKWSEQALQLAKSQPDTGQVFVSNQRALLKTAEIGQFLKEASEKKDGEAAAFALSILNPSTVSNSVRDDFAVAIEWLKKQDGVEAAEDLQRANRALGSMHYRKRNFKEAAKCYRAELESYPDGAERSARCETIISGVISDAIKESGLLVSDKNEMIFHLGVVCATNSPSAVAYPLITEIFNAFARDIPAEFCLFLKKESSEKQEEILTTRLRSDQAAIVREELRKQPAAAKAEDSAFGREYKTPAPR